MAILKQPQLVLNSQPIGQHHPLTGRSPLKRDEAAYEQHQMGQIPQRSLPDGAKTGGWRSRYSQVIEWQEATLLNAAADQSTMALFPMLVALEEQSCGMSGQSNCTTGVTPMMKQVSLYVMSH